MEPDINEVLEQNEKIFWQGFINRKVLIFSLIISILIIGFIGGFVFTKDTINFTSNGKPSQISGKLLGSIILIMGFCLSFYSYFSNRIQKYAITQKRILIKSGLIGRDFKSVYFEQIKEIVVDVGIIDKIFSVGTIKIDIGKTETYSTGTERHQSVKTRTMYTNLRSIDKPYEVYRYLQSVLRTNKESLYSGRADRESNPEAYNNQ